MEDCGICSAVRRLWRATARADLACCLPEWATSPRVDGCGMQDWQFWPRRKDVVALHAKVHRLCRELGGSPYLQNLEGMGEEEDDGSVDTHMLMVHVKFLVGVCCEEHARFAEVQHAHVDEVHSYYRDVAHAATWTSVHANVLKLCECTLGRVPTQAGAWSVACEADTADYSAHVERFLFKNNDAVAVGNMSAIGLLMIRATNPGLRGWISLILSLLPSNDDARWVIERSIHVALTGLHSLASPCARPPWQDRLRIGQCLTLLLGKTQTATICKECPLAVKSCMQQMLFLSTRNAVALMDALVDIKHPVGVSTAGTLLNREAADALCRAGAAIIKAPGQENAMEVHNALLQALNKAAAEHRLGKGSCSLQRIPTICDTLLPVWNSAFCANFVPYWIHCNLCKTRLARLGELEYDVIHSMSAASAMLRSLSIAERLQLHDRVLGDYSAAVRTIGEVSIRLQLESISSTVVRYGTRAIHHATSLTARASAIDITKLLLYSKSAWCFNTITVYLLGDRVQRHQEWALQRRNGASAQKAQAAPRLYVCTSCRRICNAMPDSRPAKKVNKRIFDEIGCPSVMTSTDESSGEVHMYCGKRMSSSSRNAMVSQRATARAMQHERDVEASDLDARTLNQCEITEPKAYVARMRRDARAAYEQRKTPNYCGKEPLVEIELLGRCIRLWNKFYTLCVLCGAVMQLTPSSWHDDGPCCMQCPDNPKKRELAAGEKPKATCRYCGKDQRVRGRPFREVKSPLDSSGKNSQLPPPLRRVHFCSQHYRSWIPSAMTKLQTHQILCHVAFNARPIIDDGVIEQVIRKRARRMPSGKRK